MNIFNSLKNIITITNKINNNIISNNKQCPDLVQPYTVDANAFNNRIHTKNIATETYFGNMPGFVIREFEPSINNITNLGYLLKSVWKSTTTIFNNIKNGNDSSTQTPKLQLGNLCNPTILKWLALKGGSKDAGVVSTLSNVLYNKNADMSKIETDITKKDDYFKRQLPIDIYSKIIAGRWNKTYTFPGVTLHNHLESDGNSGWAPYNIDNIFGSALSMIRDYSGNLLDSLNLLTGLSYSSDARGKSYSEFSVKINLFNRNIENVKANLSFLYALFGSSYWFQDGLIVNPSTLYGVYMPGRLILPLAAIHFSTKFSGKTRYISSKLFGTSFNNIPHDKNYLSIPDVYELTLTIKSVLPNNLQTYLMGQDWMGKYSPINLSTGRTDFQQSFIANFVSNLLENISSAISPPIDTSNMIDSPAIKQPFPPDPDQTYYA